MSDLTFKVSAEDKEFRKRMGEIVNVVKSVAGDLAPFLGTGFGLAAAGEVIKRSAEHMDELRLISDKTHVDPASFQQLANAADIAGVKSDQLAEMLSHMGLRLKEMPSLVESLGLNSQEFNKLSQAEKFAAIVEKLGKMPNKLQADAYSQKLLGSSYEAIAPFAEHIDEYRQRTQGQNVTSQAAVGSGSYLWQQIKRTGGNLGSAANDLMTPFYAIGGGLMSEFNDLLEMPLIGSRKTSEYKDTSGAPGMDWLIHHGKGLKDRVESGNLSDFDAAAGGVPTAAWIQQQGASQYGLSDKDISQIIAHLQVIASAMPNKDHGGKP